MTELMRRNTEFLRRGGLRRGGDFRERQFREINCFTGEESQWEEWSKKFQAVVEEENPEIYDELEWAVSETDEVTMDDVRKQFGGAGLSHSTMVYNRLRSVGPTSVCVRRVRA